MGYLHINNLYKDDRIFQFGECYALEKIHGTSAHVTLKLVDGMPEVHYMSGGETYERFKALFHEGEIYTGVMNFIHSMNLDLNDITFFGEAYGGKQQGMSATYGKDLKFIVFDVQKDGKWLNVPIAEQAAKSVGFEFVDYTRISTKLTDIDAERAKPSTQAIRNGIIEPKEREGIVLRPLEEAFDRRGNRIITKHKNDSFKETKTQREVDPERLKVLADANQIADEWVTESRLDHVMDKVKGLKQDAENELGNGCLVKDLLKLEIEDTGIIVKAMVEDVRREATGEILESKEAMKAIGAAAARMFKKRLATQFSQEEK
jgi:hypothetical protein